MERCDRKRSGYRQSIFLPSSIGEDSLTASFSAHAPQSVEMLLLLVQIHNLTYEHNVVVAALERLSDDSELRLMALETRSNAQSYYSRLENAQLWRQQFQDGFSSSSSFSSTSPACCWSLNR